MFQAFICPESIKGSLGKATRWLLFILWFVLLIGLVGLPWQSVEIPIAAKVAYSVVLLGLTLYVPRQLVSSFAPVPSNSPEFSAAVEETERWLTALEQLTPEQRDRFYALLLQEIDRSPRQGNNNGSHQSAQKSGVN